MSSNPERERCYGKYRGVVVNNVDPQQIGRIQLIVPDISPLPGSWATPCVPVAGLSSGVFTVPPVGAAVWVEFEQGDTDSPVWVGGFWGSAAEVPTMARTIPPGLSGIAIQTTLGTALVISDAPGPTGGILLKTATGAMLSISDVGITITNGAGATITLTGPTTDINLGALTVV